MLVSATFCAASTTDAISLFIADECVIELYLYTLLPILFYMLQQKSLFKKGPYVSPAALNTRIFIQQYSVQQFGTAFAPLLATL